MEKKKNREWLQVLQRLTPADGILAGVVLLAAVGSFAAYGSWFRQPGSQVTVIVHGELYGSYALSADQEIEILQEDGSSNVLQIRNGEATVIDANCPDELCTHQRAISGEGEQIICLPHQVVIRIEGAEMGGEMDEIDAIAQ